jgi:hypothetical protein
VLAAEVNVHSPDDREVYWPAVGVIDGDVYVVAWRRGRSDVAPAHYYLAVWRSVDGGATWEVAQDYATVDADVREPGTVTTSYRAGRIRWAYRDGEVVVLAHLTIDGAEADWVRQYAGPGLLSRLDTIATSQGAAGWASPDVVATPSGFLVALLERVTGAVSRTIGSAWQPLATSAQVGAITNKGIGSGWTEYTTAKFQIDTPRIGLSVVRDPSGPIWIYGISTDATIGGSGAGAAAYTPDGGASWRTAPRTSDSSSATGWWFRPDDDGGTGTHGNCPREIDACWLRGRVLMAHTWEAAVSGWDDSVAISYLGGWHDLTMPIEEDGVRHGDVASWRKSWLPYERPDDQDYTTASGGTSTSALVTVDGEHEVTTGDGAGGNGFHYFQDTGSAISGPMWAGAEWEMRLTTDGLTLSSDVGLRLRVAAAAHGVEIEINVDQTQVGVVSGGGHLTGSPFSGFVLGTLYRFALGVSMDGDTGVGRQSQLWYRAADHSENQKWTRLGSWTLPDDLGAGGTAPHIRWGNITTSGAGTQRVSRWRSVQWSLPDSGAARSNWGSAATWHDLDQAAGDNPDKLTGRLLGSEAIWLLDGMTLAGRRGPAIIGDSWVVPVSGDYEIARALSLDVPSRRVHHRTVDVSADAVTPWAVDANRPLSEDAEHPPLMALHIQCNWRLGTLQYRTVAGAWTTAATIDTRVLQGASYTRTGVYVRASDAVSTVYLHRDEVDEYWTVEWDDGAGTTRYRHPAGNSPGRWSSATTEPRARLELANTIGGDPTTGGTLSLWSPEVTVLVPGVTASAWRIVVDSTHGTADGDYRTKFAWGEAHVLAQPPSWGRGFTAIAGHDRVSLEGAMGVRVDRAPAMRELRMAWDDGVDETEIGRSDVVDFATPYTAASEPASSVGELPRSLVRMLGRAAGRPVGWVVWDRTASGAVILRRAHEQMWGTVEAAPDRETIQGEEGSTEMVRIATVSLTEER